MPDDMDAHALEVPLTPRLVAMGARNALVREVVTACPWLFDLSLTGPPIETQVLDGWGSAAALDALRVADDDSLVLLVERPDSTHADLQPDPDARRWLASAERVAFWSDYLTDPWGNQPVSRCDWAAGQMLRRQLPADLPPQGPPGTNATTVTLVVPGSRVSLYQRPSGVFIRGVL